MKKDKFLSVKELATKLQKKKKRKYSGEPYVTHTIRVAKCFRGYTNH